MHIHMHIHVHSKFIRFEYTCASVFCILYACIVHKYIHAWRSWRTWKKKTWTMFNVHSMFMLCKEIVEWYTIYSLLWMWDMVNAKDIRYTIYAFACVYICIYIYIFGSLCLYAHKYVYNYRKMHFPHSPDVFLKENS